MTVVGYRSYKKVRRESERVIFLCKSCGNAWTELDRGVRVRGRLPRFKILRSCPSCNKDLFDEQSSVVQTDSGEAYVGASVSTRTLENNKLE